MQLVTLGCGVVEDQPTGFKLAQQIAALVSTYIFFSLRVKRAGEDGQAAKDALCFLTEVLITETERRILTRASQPARIFLSLRDLVAQLGDVSLRVNLARS